MSLLLLTLSVWGSLSEFSHSCGHPRTWSNGSPPAPKEAGRRRHQPRAAVVSSGVRGWLLPFATSAGIAEGKGSQG